MAPLHETMGREMFNREMFKTIKFEIQKEENCSKLIGVYVLGGVLNV